MKNIKSVINCNVKCNTLSVSIVTLGRSLSILRKLKNDLRSTMIEIRFIDLSVLNIYKNISVNINTIVDTFSTENNRKMKLKESLK